jgi:hypothetical protein
MGVKLKKSPAHCQTIIADATWPSRLIQERSADGLVRAMIEAQFFPFTRTGCPAFV